MKVLVAIDGSAHSQAVLNWVKRTPWPGDTRFLVMSAAPVTVNAYAATEIGGSKVVDDFQREELVAHHETIATADRSLREAGLAVESRVELGDPRDLIVRVATSEGVGMIVVGSHGHGGLARLLIGSVADFVSTHAPCNVVIVKEPAD